MSRAEYSITDCIEIAGDYQSSSDGDLRDLLEQNAAARRARVKDLKGMSQGYCCICEESYIYIPLGVAVADVGKLSCPSCTKLISETLE